MKNCYQTLSCAFKSPSRRLVVQTIYRDEGNCTGIFDLFYGSQSAVICLAATVFSPCSCDEYKGNSGTIELNCGGNNVDDTRLSAILDTLLTTPGVSPVGALMLWNNLLTRVPDQTLFSFHSTRRRFKLQEKPFLTYCRIQIHCHPRVRSYLTGTVH